MKNSPNEPTDEFFGFEAGDTLLTNLGDALEPPSLAGIGPYELQEEIGRGGQGIAIEHADQGLIATGEEIQSVRDESASWCRERGEEDCAACLLEAGSKK